MTDSSTVTGSSTLGTSGTTLGTSGTTLSPANNGMGEQDFLTLMMDQLKAQDPLSPNDPSQFLGELAQFSSLEQQNSIATSTQQSASAQSTSSALALLGHTVSYTDANGVTQSGTVSKVDFTTSGATLTVGSTSGVLVSKVTEAT